MDMYADVAQRLLEIKQCVVLSGAGISAESGIATFRDPGGLWHQYDPAVYASIEGFRNDPSKYWEIRGDFIRNYDRFQPNAAHRALAEMEQLGMVAQIITQNIDGLHRKAGSRNVIEIHGSLREINCLQCRKKFLAPNIPPETPPYCECGGVLKPNTVLFGESLPPNALASAYEHAQNCRMMLVVGTSAVVYPAAHLPAVAKENGAVIVEINLERAFAAADFAILEKAGTALPRLLETVKNLMSTRH